MGHASHVLHMIFIIVFFLISFSCTTHILISNVQVDGNKDQEKAQILEKFRFLLHLGKSFTFGKSTNVQFSTYISSPSPSPSPSPAPAPSPAVRIHHRHAHPPLHHHHSLPQPQKVPKKEQGKKAARVLTAVLASFGVTFAFCAVGLFFVCLKLKKNKKKQRTRIISRFISSSQSSVKKVSSDPGPDLFYLDSLESAFEPEKSCSTKMNNTLICCASDEREGSNNKLLMTNSECDDSGGCCSNSFAEITTVHEISEQCDVRGSNSSCGERITPEEIHAFEEKTVLEETHSSDDESFHSFCDSQSSSSHLRLSNASASSILAQISEILSQEEQNAPPPEIPSPSPPPPPTPPPPPPPPPQTSPPSSGKTKSHFLNSPKPQDLSQTRIETRPNPPPGVPAPPPCPPPLPKGQMISLKIPPPPPNSGITQQIPLGKDGSPLTKLKPLHWDKVRAAPNRSTVWDKLRSSSFEFDEEMIESLFSYNLQNTTKNDDVKSKTPSPSKHVLEPKRLQNITILSKALNVTAEQVCGALLRGDGLSLQDLEALSKMVPTKEEEAKLANYKGDMFELGSAEKLVKAMLKIPFAFPRIEAMLYRETFQDEVLHLTKSFSMLQEACEELRSSRLFLKLLEAVLKTGNRMNVGTIRGGAKAFKLDALLKLSDVKGTDGKTTLLHFVVQEIIRSEGIRVSESIMGKIHQKSSNSNSNTTQDKEAHYRKMGLDLVSGLSSELCNAKKTATIDLDVLATSVATLSEGLHKLKNLVEKEMMLVHNEKKGTFVDNLRCFVKHAETKLKEVRDEENRVLMNVREITEYFHGDVGKDEANPLRIFVIVRDFLSMLDNVCKELRSSKAPRSHNPLAPFR